MAERATCEATAAERLRAHMSPEGSGEDASDERGEDASEPLHVKHHTTPRKEADVLGIHASGGSGGAGGDAPLGLKRKRTEADDDTVDHTPSWTSA